MVKGGTEMKAPRSCGLIADGRRPLRGTREDFSVKKGGTAAFAVPLERKGRFFSKAFAF